MKVDKRTPLKAFWDGFRGERDDFEFLGGVCRVVVEVGVLVLLVTLISMLCSCAPRVSPEPPWPDAYIQPDTIDTPTEYVDSVPIPRAPWSPGGRPVRWYVLNVEPGIWHGYWNDQPFLFGFLYDGDKPRYVLSLDVMTGSAVVVTPCIIELRRTNGRP